MLIEEMSGEECRKLLARATMVRLGCALDNQPYVLPVYCACEQDHVYVLSTFGQKVEWMRLNPKVSVQADEITSQSDWKSVVANGRYRELRDPLDEVEISRARTLLGARHQWWLNALAERRAKADDLSIAPLFFSIDVDSVTGLHARPGNASDGAGE